MDSGNVHVHPAWISGTTLDRLRGATHELAASQARARNASLRPRQPLLLHAVLATFRTPSLVQAMAAATRHYASHGVHTRAADLLSPDLWPEMPPPLLELIAALDRLRLNLTVASGRPFMEIIELQMLSYARGGQYARHLDTGGDSDQV